MIINMNTNTIYNKDGFNFTKTSENKLDIYSSLTNTV